MHGCRLIYGAVTRVEELTQPLQYVPTRLIFYSVTVYVSTVLERPVHVQKLESGLNA